MSFSYKSLQPIPCHCADYYNGVGRLVAAPETIIEECEEADCKRRRFGKGINVLVEVGLQYNSSFYMFIFAFLDFLFV